MPAPSIEKLDANFPRYTDNDPAVPVWLLTPGKMRTMHRFFDTSPVSPSGRYVGLTRFPAEDRPIQPGEPAEIVVVDLETGEEEVVALTRGWDTQTGAHVQWGRDDTELFYNDMDTERWRPFGIKLNPGTGERIDLEYTVYFVSHDGRQAISCDIRGNTNLQRGFGVIAPDSHIPKHSGAANDDGIWITDCASGKTRLLISFEQVIEGLGKEMDSSLRNEGGFYGLHVKWNPQGTRIMLVLAWLNHNGAQQRNVVTMDADGSNPRLAVPWSEWAKGGNHPNWMPDGNTILMNVRIEGPETPFRYIRVNFDGSDYRSLSDEILGGGHPSMHMNERHVLSDAYPHELHFERTGTTPIRLADLRSDIEHPLCRIRTTPDYEGEKSIFRVDPHPAWDRSFRRIVFHGCPQGGRQPFLADVSQIVGRSQGSR